MSELSEIVDDLEARGFRFTVTDQRSLSVEGAQELTESDADLIGQHKAALIDWLERRDSAPRFPGRMCDLGWPIPLTREGSDEVRRIANTNDENGKRVGYISACRRVLEIQN